jgi:hypothetical protein
MFSSIKHTSSRIEPKHIQQVKFWMPSMSILAVLLPWIAPLDVQRVWFWPPCIPDLNPYNYFLKDSLYRNNPYTIYELKEDISSVVIKSPADTLCQVVAIVHCQLQMVFSLLVVHILNMFSKSAMLINAKGIPVHEVYQKNICNFNAKSLFFYWLCMFLLLL